MMQNSPGSNLRKKIWKSGLLILAGLLFIQLVFVLMVLAGVFGKIPDNQELRSIQNPMATEVYTADGVLMGTYYIENRQFLEPSEIPEEIKYALIATEDVRFYKHKGIDVRSLLRVFFKSILLRNEAAGGGSTLSQQLAKNLYPRGDYRVLSMPVNKVREMATARRLEKVYSKEEILDMYLSTVSFGENTFGIKAASRRYFNREPNELDLEEAAVLVGMLKATQLYNPVQNPDRALSRRNVVLAQMAKYEYLDASEADSLQLLPLVADYHPLPHNAGIAPYFREFIRAELDLWCREHFKSGPEAYNLYTDGLKIYTSIDSRLQLYAENAMRDHMSHLQILFEKQWEGNNLWRGVSEEQMLINYQGKHRPGMASEAPRRMEVFTWEGQKEKEYNTLDSIKHYLRLLQAGFLAMDVRTAEVRAWVGGINHEYFKYDHVLARRQPGSVFKPLVYLEALEQGVSPCDYFSNDSVVYHDYEDWTPRNADRSYGGHYSLKGALVHSVNTVSVEVLMQVGIDSVLELCQKAGIKSPLPEVPSLALGSGSVSLFEMVGVYQAIANRGISKDPVYLKRIEDRNGKLLFEADPDPGGLSICEPENAEVMIEILKAVVNDGTAAALRNTYGFTADIAGKTGTTQNNTDGWFIGFTPGLVAGVWVGGDLQNVRFPSIQYGQGAYAAMPIWSGFMHSAFKDDTWAMLQDQTFRTSEAAQSRLDCDDFKEKKFFEIPPIKKLRKRQPLRNLFRRKKKRS
jgi:penicillin-binding protein 1A